MTFIQRSCCLLHPRDRDTHPRNDSQDKHPLNVVCGQDRAQHHRKERSHHSHSVGDKVYHPQ